MEQIPENEELEKQIAVWYQEILDKYKGTSFEGDE